MTRATSSASVAVWSIPRSMLRNQCTGTDTTAHGRGIRPQAIASATCSPSSRPSVTPMSRQARCLIAGTHCESGGPYRPRRTTPRICTPRTFMRRSRQHAHPNCRSSYGTRVTPQRQQNASRGSRDHPASSIRRRAGGIRYPSTESSSQPSALARLRFRCRRRSSWPCRWITRAIRASACGSRGGGSCAETVEFPCMSRLLGAER